MSPPPPAPPALRALAEQAARIGGQTARAAFGRPGPVRLKADRSEVSQGDLEAQRAIAALLRAQRPGDGLLCEEHDPLPGGPAPDAARIWWLIDPVDGTRNYVRGIPVYTCSVAAVCDGTPLAGAIYDPAQDRLYSADVQQGLHIDGRPAARAATMPQAARPLVGIPSTCHGAARAVLLEWLERCILRNLGSTALHLALVAEGRLAGALVADARLWDIAAGWVLIRAAGGCMRALDGRELFPLDPARYRGEPLACLAACDEPTWDALRPRGA